MNDTFDFFRQFAADSQTPGSPSQRGEPFFFAPPPSQSQHQIPLNLFDSSQNLASRPLRPSLRPPARVRGPFRVGSRASPTGPRVTFSDSFLNHDQARLAQPTARRGLDFSGMSPKLRKPPRRDTPPVAPTPPAATHENNLPAVDDWPMDLNLTDFIDRRVDQAVHLDETQELFEERCERPVALELTQRTPGGTRAGSVGLIPTSVVPPKFRPIFRAFTHFNIVQSEVLHDVLRGDAPAVVVSAPTGSGKTAVFELAMVKALDENDNAKMIYISPTKSLCNERLRDWEAKFASLNVRCMELTGDTGNTNFAALANADLVFTTPEKWDVVTRQRIKDAKPTSWSTDVALVMLDEVHILGDVSRGHTLEVVVTRMRTAAKARGRKQPRFVAASATVPNADDLASWLSDGDARGIFHHFGEERRPVPLKRVVVGVPSKESEFKFEMLLSYKLLPLISTFGEGKPTLVFCNSRRSAQATAAAMLRDARGALPISLVQRQAVQNAAERCSDKKLAESLAMGIGFHHAGLKTEDRHIVEEVFVSGHLPVLVSTTTLALGVNLPAHLVVIKGTKLMENGSFKEYSEAQVANSRLDVSLTQNHFSFCK